MWTEEEYLKTRRDYFPLHSPFFPTPPHPHLLLEIFFISKENVFSFGREI